MQVESFVGSVLLESRIQNFIKKRLEHIFNDIEGIPTDIFTHYTFQNYANKDAQRIYNLKYLYAYLLEYYEIFQHLIELNYIKRPYKVLSLGTGSGLEFMDSICTTEKVRNK